MRTSHRGRRQRAAAQSPRKINLSVSVSPRPSTPVFLFLLLARSHRPPLSLDSPLDVSPQPGSSPSSLLTWAPRVLSFFSSHLHYVREREDLLAAEYNADLSVSIHRDREPSSSRVPLRRGYTYPPSAARRGHGKGEERRKKQRGTERDWTLSRSILRLAE